MLFLFVGLVFTSCSGDSLDSQSVITETSSSPNELDFWLVKNYVQTYNVDFKYRIDNRENNYSYSLTPVTYERGVAFAKILMHTWLKTYDEVKGQEFTQTYIPKNIVCIGSKQGNTVGEAEGGVKITFFNLNERINLDNLTVESLTGKTDTTGNGNEESASLKTAFHEFSHILHQNKALPEDFSLVSDKDYVGGDWDTFYKNPIDAWSKGIISKYAGSSPNEDFAEMIALYVTRGPAMWSAVLKKADQQTDKLLDALRLAGVTDATVLAKIEADRPSIKLTTKMSKIRSYLKNSWNIELDEMQAIFYRRVNELPEMDLTNLD